MDATVKSLPLLRSPHRTHASSGTCAYVSATVLAASNSSAATVAGSWDA
jgi:hypothetical protein